MDRNKRRVNPSRGSKKADTPIKPALGGKHGKLKSTMKTSLKPSRTKGRLCITSAVLNPVFDTFRVQTFSA